MRRWVLFRLRVLVSDKFQKSVLSYANHERGVLIRLSPVKNKNKLDKLLSILNFFYGIGMNRFACKMNTNSNSKLQNAKSRIQYCARKYSKRSEPFFHSYNTSNLGVFGPLNTNLSSKLRNLKYNGHFEFLNFEFIFVISDHWIPRVPSFIRTIHLFSFWSIIIFIIYYLKKE